MTKSVTVGLASGLALVLLTLLAVGLLNLPGAETAVADDSGTSASCPVVQVAQDQGYGVAKTVERHVCAAAIHH